MLCFLEGCACMPVVCWWSVHVPQHVWGEAFHGRKVISALFGYIILPGGSVSTWFPSYWNTTQWNLFASRQWYRATCLITWSACSTCLHMVSCWVFLSTAYCTEPVSCICSLASPTFNQQLSFGTVAPFGKHHSDFCSRDLHFSLHSMLFTNHGLASVCTVGVSIVNNICKGTVEGTARLFFFGEVTQLVLNQYMGQQSGGGGRERVLK